MEKLISQSPKIVIQQIMNNGGTIIMGDKKVISDSFNDANLESTVIQSEDVKQENVHIKTSESDKAFQDLFNAIQDLDEGNEKVQAELNAEILQKTIESGDKQAAKKVWGLLRNTLGDISSLITIGQFLA